MAAQASGRRVRGLPGYALAPVRMNGIEVALRRIASDLDQRALGWALIGGFAVSTRAEPRFTRYVDVAVAVTDDETAERLIRDLTSDGYELLASIEQDAIGRLATVRLASVASPDVVVDVLFASSGIEPEIARAAERIEVMPGLLMPVATIGHLIAVKLLARDDETRPQDHTDLLALRTAADEHDMDVARKGAELITSRGYHRGRDLVTALANLRARP